MEMEYGNVNRNNILWKWNLFFPYSSSPTVFGVEFFLHSAGAFFTRGTKLVTDGDVFILLRQSVGTSRSRPVDGVLPNGGKGPRITWSFWSDTPPLLLLLRRLETDTRPDGGLTAIGQLWQVSKIDGWNAFLRLVGISNPLGRQGLNCRSLRYVEQNKHRGRAFSSAARYVTFQFCVRSLLCLSRTKLKLPE